MKIRLLPLFALLLPLSASPQLYAQGSAFTYQGQLNGASGPATGNYDFRFTVYDSMLAGNAVAGPVTNSAVSVNDGLFTTTIDLGSAAFNGSSRWLDISVRTNGSSAFFTLSPRQAFTPTPYSISAATITGPVPAAQLAGTVPASAVAGTYDRQLTLNNAGNQFTGGYSGNGAGLTNVNAAKLVGTLASAQLSGAYNSALALNNMTNSYNGNALNISGNKSGGWGAPVSYIENLNSSANASPALRVVSSGALGDGALSVSANGTGLIARFGNAATWVADLTTNGTFEGAFAGNGSGLTGLNAAQLTGTLPSALVGGTYSSAVSFNNQSDNFTGSYYLGTNGTLRLNDRPLYLRAGGDVNHGLAYCGNGLTNFGAGTAQLDGPILWGWGGGALGVASGGQRPMLSWTTGGVGIGTTAPANPFEVLGSGTITGGVSGFPEVAAHFQNTRSGSHSAVSVDANPSQDSILYFSQAGAAKWGLRYDHGNNNFELRNHQGGANSTALSVDSSGALSVAGNISANNMPALNYVQANIGNEDIAVSQNAQYNLGSEPNYKPAIGYFVVVASAVITGGNGGLVNLELWDVSGTPGLLNLVYANANPCASLSLTWVIPVTSVGGYQNLALEVNSTEMSFHVRFHNMTVMFFPKLNT